MHRICRAGASPRPTCILKNKKDTTLFAEIADRVILSLYRRDYFKPADFAPWAACSSVKLYHSVRYRTMDSWDNSPYVSL